MRPHLRILSLFGACLLLMMIGLPVRAQESPDFVEAIVDRTTAYVGEPILYTWRWYLAMAVVEGTEADSRVVRPKFDSFGQETLEVSTESTIRGGQTYQIITQQIVLYPRQQGVFTFDPLRVLVPETPFSPAQTLESAPLTLTIKPLPADAPPTFGNAIGQFDLQAALDYQAAKTGDPLTLTMTITGSGNAPLIAPPQLTLGAEWRVYAGKSTTRRDGPLLGERIFTWTLIPLQPGALAIPSQTWSFLNPQTGQYETRATTPFSVSVTGEAISEPQIAPPVVEPTLYPLHYSGPGRFPARSYTELLSQDRSVNMLKPYDGVYIGPRFPNSSRSGVSTDVLDVTLAMLPAVIVFVIWLMSFVWRVQPKNIVKTQKRKRSATFEDRIAMLDRKLPQEVAVSIQTILREYLSQQHGTPITAETLPEALKRFPLPIRTELQACFDLANTARYAPFAAEDAKRLIQDAQHVIQTMEAL